MAQKNSAEHPEEHILVGRQEQLDLLCGRLEYLAKGRGGCVVLKAGAGLGKSHLLEAVLAQARAKEIQVLRGSADARGMELAYGLVAGALGDYLDKASAVECKALAETIGTLAPHLWHRLFDGENISASQVQAEGNPELRQSLFISRVTRLLLAYASHKPLVVVLEDLHWADSASLRLVHYLVRSGGDHPVLVLATSRPEGRGKEETAVLRRLFQDLHLYDHFTQLELDPLDQEQTEQLVDAHLGDTNFKRSFYAQLHAKSGGVPFYVLQQVDYLVDQGVVFETQGLWVERGDEDLPIPDSVREAVEVRLKLLDEDKRHVLSHAAVQGDVFEGRLVARTIGWMAPTVLKLLGQIGRTTRLLTGHGKKFRFAHTTLTEVFYSLLPASARSRAHMRLAELLEKQDGKDVEGLAYHLYRAGEYARSLPYVLEAARRARASFAFGEARRLLNRAGSAIEALGVDAVEPQLLRGIWLETAAIEEKSGDPGVATSLCHQVIDQCPPGDVDAGQALMQLGAVLTRQGKWGEAIANYQQARALYQDLGDQELQAQVPLRLGIIAFERGQLDEANSRFTEAKELASGCGSQTLLGNICGNLGVVASVRGQYNSSIVYFTAALKAYRKAGNNYGMCQTYHNLGMTHGVQQEWTIALKCYAQGEELAREMGTVDVLANILVSRVPAHLGQAQVEEAEKACAQAQHFMEQLQDQLGLAECAKVAAMVAAGRGRWEAAAAGFVQAHNQFEKLENMLGAAECELELGRMWLGAGQAEKARSWLGHARQHFSDLGAKADMNKAAALLAELAGEKEA